MDHCLDVYQQDILIYVGEYGDGCTAWSERLDTEWEMMESIDIPTY